jgi:hypothetical protein
MEMGELDLAEATAADAVQKAKELRPTPFELISKM